MLGRMAATTPIISIPNLRISARRSSIAPDDEVANWVVAEASARVCDYARHPEWEDPASGVSAPRQAKRIALAVATRVFLNPELERSSSIGGVLSSSNAPEWALGFELSDSEKEELDDLRNGGNGNRLGVISLAGSATYDETLYVADESGSDWMIPYFDTADIEAYREPDDVVIP